MFRAPIPNPRAFPSLRQKKHALSLNVFRMEPVFLFCDSFCDPASQLSEDRTECLLALLGHGISDPHSRAHFEKNAVTY